MSSKDLHNHNFSWSSSVSFLWWSILFISIGRLKQILKGDSGFPLCIFSFVNVQNSWSQGIKSFSDEWGIVDKTRIYEGQSLVAVGTLVYAMEAELHFGIVAYT